MILQFGSTVTGTTHARSDLDLAVKLDTSNVSLQTILEQLGHVAEGVYSAREVAKLAKANGVEMPVTDAVNGVLEGKLTPKASVEQLLSRDLKQER